MGRKEQLKKAIRVRLQHPSGKITTKKLFLRSTSLSAVQKEFLATAEHKRTEAFPIAIIKEKIKRKIKRRKATIKSGRRDWRILKCHKMI